ncbi:MAG: GNAT family N-acetyltransferase [Nitrospinae bacterium]|nr:GNAT family N-acetyltransferase [Nitrospinota bacterium]MBL7020723.1 GNAT family N-acetyltransferase [Nitrospinaceae bacterium]
MIPELNDLFALFPDLRLTVADKALCKKFHYGEPQLVSCSDNFEGEQEEEILVLYEKDRPLGMVTTVIRENINKPAYPKNYARLDLVIVDKKYRNIGVARLLIVCSLLKIMKNQGHQIYSISCLAGHKTVAKFMKELHFQEHHQKEKNFWQGILNLEENSLESLIGLYREKAEKCLHWTGYQMERKNKIAQHDSM